MVSSNKYMLIQIQFPNLVDLKLASINVEKLWPNQLTELPPLLKNLTTLIIDYCDNLSYLFMSSMVENLMQLKSIEISNCKSMKEVIVTEGEEMMSKIVFPVLQSLKLKSLESITRFCVGNLIECSSLKVLLIENCPLLQTFISSSISTDVETSSRAGQANSILFDAKVLLPNLESLCVINTPALKMLWCDELQTDSFCSLRELQVKHGKELVKIFPSEQLPRFKKLESLIVEDCNLIEEVFDLQVLMKMKEETDDVAATQLRYLEMVELPNLNKVWNGDPLGILSFHNLQDIRAVGCTLLKNLFPFSVAQSLPQLENISLIRCPMEEIVEKEERIAANPKFEFPRLISLHLMKLGELKCFYPEKHILECAQLESLHIYFCDKLEAFTSEDLQTPSHLKEKQKSQVPQPLFSIEKVIPNLKQLSLDSKHTAMIRHSQFPTERLEFLELQCFHDDSRDSQFDFLKKFQNIKSLGLGNCDFKVLFTNDILVQGVRVFTQLEYLKLAELPYMSQIWGEDCQPGLVFPNLNVLLLWTCNSLITLAPPSASFRYLSTLYVQRCHGLLKLIESSTAKSLVNLTTLTVEDCNKVTEIVANEEHASQSDSQSQIVLRNLERLKLCCLKNLTSFCSVAHCTIRFPSLKEVVVVQCPNMKIFSQEVVLTPSLKRVYMNEERDKWLWTGNLNDTIKQLYEDMVGFSGLQHLKLSEFPQVKRAWHNRLPVQLFRNLNILEIDDCRYTSSLVPTNLLPYLDNLKMLEVRNCDAVEQVFGPAWPNANGFAGHLSNLTILTVHGCDNLKHVLSSSMMRSVVNLKEIEICHCEKLEQVVFREAVEEPSIISETLISIKLENLPKLTQFCTSTSIKCPSLQMVKIENCPELMTFVSNSESSVNASSSELEISNSTLFDEKVLFPNLKKLHMKHVHKLKMVWNDELQEDSFCELNDLQIRHGTELLKIFPSKQLQRFKNLNYLIVEDCNLIEEVFDLQVLMKIHEETDIVTAAQLTVLCIKGLPNLKNIWSGDPCGILSFHNMRNILVSHCPNLKNLLPFSIAQNLPQLELLCIDDCGRMEEIVAKEERVEETHKFIFPQLKSLLLDGSNELKCFFPEKHTLECIQLDELRVNGCNKLKIFISTSGDLQTTVVDMKQKSQMKSLVMQLFFSFAELMSIDGARKLDMSRSIQNLTTLTVSSCGNLTSLLPSSMVKVVPHLKRLVVQDCEKMEEVVFRDGSEAETTLLLRELQFLKLKDLPKLTRFCACDLIACPSLNELHIYKCPVMMTFVSSSASDDIVASHEREILNHALFNEKVVFPNLERIEIFNVNTLKKIWHNQLHLGSFYKLQVMKVLHCNQLTEIFPSNIFRRLECLKDVLIGHCDSLEVVFNNLSHQGPIIILKRSGASELRNLNIQNLPNLKHIWNQDPQHVLSFPSISSVRVSKCPSLKILFPASVARNLLQLEAIYLDDCCLGELVAKKEGAETNPMFAFPWLKSWCFLNLKELRCFYFGKHALFCPVLEKLVVYDCGRLKVFAFKPVDNDLQETQMEYPLFSFKEIVSNLEDLSLTDKDARMIQQSQLPANLFHKLKVVQIVSYHDESALLPFDLLGIFQNMEELRVHYSRFKELFPLVGKEKYVETMRLIQRLKLYNLAKLQHIWNQDSQLDKDFQSLESLNIRDCNSLTALAPSSASFPNLTTVYIESCKVLAMLMTPSTAKSLVQLTKLSINKCNNLTEIVATEGIDGSKEKIIFNKLETLELLYLPSLVSFCSAEHSFSFPCLTQVIVQECPKMQFFSNGVLITPKLQSLRVAQEDDEGRWSGNLNSIIKELSTEMARREKKLEMRWVVPLNPCLINPNLLTRHNNSQTNVEVSIGLKGIGDI